MKIDKTDALLLVDIQNDFFPEGALPAKDAYNIFPKVNNIQNNFENIFASQDWHPKDHKSFAVNNHGKREGEFIKLGGLSQVMWPVHCVQESEGARFHAQLDTSKIKEVIQKGTRPDIDSYSAFFDNGRLHKTNLDDILQKNNIKKLFIAGLTLDYCVKFSALDAKSLGYDVYVVVDATAAVNLQANDADKAIKEMQNKGINIISADGLG